jgi:hypothetical protein
MKGRVKMGEEPDTQGIAPPHRTSIHPTWWHYRDRVKREALVWSAITRVTVPRRSSWIPGLWHLRMVSDFSVVPFRSTFMLFSEKNRIKVHKNQ